MQKLIDLLHAIRPLSPALLTFLQTIVQYKILSKGQHLLKEGQIAGIVCFIEKGALRFYKRKDDRITNNWFSIDGDLCLSTQSFFRQQPGEDYIQALEPTVIWYIHREQLEEIYRRFPEFNFHGRILIERYHLISEKMSYPLRLRFKAERYQYLKEHFPRLLERVPMTYLASYLQTTEFTLSRIRHSLREG